MKLRAARKFCTGHARCHDVGGDIFVLGEDGYTALTVIQVSQGGEHRARMGARACPERAIEVVEDDD
ncbi:MAG: ferredoxin [Myxococcales bacterium]|nr:ferredoxin [Myxococcales bacterium]